MAIPSSQPNNAYVKSELVYPMCSQSTFTVLRLLCYPAFQELLLLFHAIFNISNTVVSAANYHIKPYPQILTSAMTNFTDLTQIPVKFL